MAECTNKESMGPIKERILCHLADVPLDTGNKITIVGAGQVGMACAIALLTEKVSNNICIIDVNEEKAQCEALDLQHGSFFLNNPKITGGSDFALSANSHVYIITAGVTGKGDTSRLALVEQNAAIIKSIVPEIVKASPNSIILMVSNPVDVLTYLAWKISGFSKQRVIGSGTTLDSIRFRYFISQRLNIAPTCCNAYVIGEHGDSSVPVWSAVSVGGVSLRDLDPCIGVAEDDEHWDTMGKQVVSGAKDVIKGKGYTSWAIGLCASSIVAAILSNSNSVLAVTTSIKGMYDIDNEVFLSMPCVLNSNGITSIMKLNLTPHEAEMLQTSANVLVEAQNRLEI